ncbi:hypothetical protein PoB_000856900 [Plakobranchus ocellatus]|uniref:Small EDRK-rich factor-like N-terminal domain-containing protein n=1 Tax=Plakobranchus ocellatus TaxID=259542 RepID=A0AAV3YGD2_9GAST|nr:hypothetical protein PoB_000856900 [Plakobranchus ocellatus]
MTTAQRERIPGAGSGTRESCGQEQLIQPCTIASSLTFEVTVAVAEYNMGSSGRHLFFPAVGCALSSATTSLGQERDKTRIRKAEAVHEAPAQRKRELRKQAQQRAQQDATRAESSPS